MEGDAAGICRECEGWVNVRVFYHDRCFDGACSASIFTRFHRERIGTAKTFDYVGLAHKPGGLFNEVEYSDGENAIVDFKYSNAPEVTWWFDHHQSAFLNDADRAQYEAGQKDGTELMRKYFDPNYTSCAGLIAFVTHRDFGFDTAPLLELLHWADIVDGAKYESAQAAVEMKEPAMQLTLVIESAPDSLFGQKLIPLLTEMPLQKVLDQDFVQAALGPQLEKHHASIELLRERAKCEKGTIYFDITDQPTEGYSKFIPYYLIPEANYVVGLSKSSFRVKISVGTNPWTKLMPDKLVNIAAICERYGGGGHARVGAISFSPDKEEDARKAAAEIVEELRASA
jgi:hypothetical protein